jgi:hypothetical protein
MKKQRWIYETYVICKTQNSKKINWSYPPMRSDDPDPCPASLVMSPGRRCFGQSRRRSQKPNCNTLTCGWVVTLKWFCSRVPSGRGSPLLNLSQREAEGERSHAAHHTTPHHTPRHAWARPGRQRRARVWHTLVRFLTSQVRWNNSHHISQAKRPLNFQYGTIVILHHYTP